MSIIHASSQSKWRRLPMSILSIVSVKHLAHSSYDHNRIMILLGTNGITAILFYIRDRSRIDWAHHHTRLLAHNGGWAGLGVQTSHS